MTFKDDNSVNNKKRCSERFYIDISFMEMVYMGRLVALPCLDFGNYWQCHIHHP